MNNLQLVRKEAENNLKSRGNNNKSRKRNSFLEIVRYLIHGITTFSFGSGDYSECFILVEFYFEKY